MIAVSVTSIFFASCNQEAGISDQQVSDYIKIQIPPYLTVKSVTLQRLTVASQGVGVVQTLRSYGVSAKAQRSRHGGATAEFHCSLEGRV
jgi:hypothetical protein